MKNLSSLNGKKLTRRNLITVQGGAIDMDSSIGIDSSVETANYCVPHGCSGKGCAKLDSVTQDT